MTAGKSFRAARRCEVVDRHGERVGWLATIWLDEGSGREWGFVRTGLFSRRLNVVPLDGSQRREGVMWVPHAREHITHAPGVASDEGLTADELRSLTAHYGLAETGVR